MAEMTQELAVLSGIPEYVRQMQPYRPGKPIEELKEEYGFSHVIKLASNENPYGVSPKAIEAAKSGMGDAFRYPDPISRKLRRKIAARLGITPEEIVVGAGSESLLACVVRTFMRPGDKALTCEGAFMGLAIHLSAHGGQLVQVPSPNYRFDIDAVLDALTPDTKLLYLPNPNNPTGSYFTHDELVKIMDRVPAHVCVLLDEAYIEYCSHIPDYPKCLDVRKDNLLILRTFSKAYGLGGLRIGYGIGHPALIEQLAKVKMTFEPSLPAQLAAEAAWDDDVFLTRGIQNNREQLDRYYKAFDTLNLRYVPSAGNFVMVDLGTPARVEALNLALLQRGLAIRSLGSFGFPQCIRITVGLPEENDALLAALEAILPSL